MSKLKMFIQEIASMADRCNDCVTRIFFFLQGSNFSIFDELNKQSTAMNYALYTIVRVILTILTTNMISAHIFKLLSIREKNNFYSK